MPFIKIATVDELLPGKGKCVKTGIKSIALFRVEEQFFALDDYCPHQGAPIANGYLTATDITCTWHGATFDLATGKGLSGPCGGGITPYPVRIIDDIVEIEVDEEMALAHGKASLAAASLEEADSFYEDLDD